MKDNQLSSPGRLIARMVIPLLLFASSAKAGWELTFQDEFSGASLDRTKWKTKDLWGNQTLPGNNEKQCYVDDAFSQSGGILSISAIEKHIPKAQCRTAKADMHYASGMLTTAGCNKWEKGPHCASLRKFSQAYGYFEIRAKFPKGKGFWPAFWLVPDDGAWPPEIDVVEWLGHEVKTAHMTLHFNDAGGKHKKAPGVYVGPDFSQDFHTFAVDWRPGLLIWYVDGVERHRVAGPTVPSQPMYLLVNLAVGGYWPGNPNANTPFPSRMEVDYLRVYKRTEDRSDSAHPPPPGRR
jgi:beta-glucanase (GH16 family)